jgi:putative addiction module killer protein
MKKNDANVNDVDKTTTFSKWLGALKDIEGKQVVNRRIKQAKKGNFGDVGSVGEGVSEMRIHYGPGYRVYYCQRGERLYLLLLGGNKKNQPADVQRAKEMKRELEGGSNGNQPIQ